MSLLGGGGGQDGGRGDGSSCSISVGEMSDTAHLVWENVAFVGEEEDVAEAEQEEETQTQPQQQPVVVKGTRDADDSGAAGENTGGSLIRNTVVVVGSDVGGEADTVAAAGELMQRIKGCGDVTEGPRSRKMEAGSYCGEERRKEEAELKRKNHLEKTFCSADTKVVTSATAAADPRRVTSEERNDETTPAADPRRVTSEERNDETTAAADPRRVTSEERNDETTAAAAVFTITGSAVEARCDGEFLKGRRVKFAAPHSDTSQIASSQSLSSSSVGEKCCRICHSGDEDGSLRISPCHCSGTSAYIHPACLQKWIETSRNDMCEICKYKYEVTRSMKPLTQWRVCCTGKRSMETALIIVALLMPPLIMGAIICYYMHTRNIVTTNNTTNTIGETGDDSFTREGMRYIAMFSILLTTLTAYIAALVYLPRRCYFLWRMWIDMNQTITVSMGGHVTVVEPNHDSFSTEGIPIERLEVLGLH